MLNASIFPFHFYCFLQTSPHYLICPDCRHHQTDNNSLLTIRQFGSTNHINYHINPFQCIPFFVVATSINLLSILGLHRRSISLHIIIPFSWLSIRPNLNIRVVPWIHPHLLRCTPSSPLTPPPPFQD